jgi:hypothetical protein
MIIKITLNYIRGTNDLEWLPDLGWRNDPWGVYIDWQKSTFCLEYHAN